MKFNNLSLVLFLTLILLSCGTPHTNKFNFSSEQCGGEAVDVDGNKYPVVKIGDQCWLGKNLKTTKYTDGSDIKEYAIVDENLGKLYQWSVVQNEKGVCPKGWRVPSDEDIKVLERSIGIPSELVETTGWRGENNEVRKLKLTDSDREWTDEKKKSVNSTGFSLEAAGAKSGWGFQGAEGSYADIWTTTEVDEDKAWNRSITWIRLHPNKSKIRRAAVVKDWSFSIRCLKN